eukprot:1150170-Pelagomonas_calceolata.AAC.4
MPAVPCLANTHALLIAAQAASKQGEEEKKRASCRTDASRVSFSKLQCNLALKCHSSTGCQQARRRRGGPFAEQCHSSAGGQPVGRIKEEASLLQAWRVAGAVGRRTEL